MNLLRLKQVKREVSNAPSINSPVVIEERIRPALTLLFGMQKCANCQKVLFKNRRSNTDDAVTS